MSNIIFVHGYERRGKGFKGPFLRNIFPNILTPDFKGNLKNRMVKLNGILREKDNWIIIGSSFGGLMGALFTCQNPKKVSLLILLAPLLVFPKLNAIKEAVNVPVMIFHSENDLVIPLDSARNRAKELFNNLKYNVVDDDHMLRLTMTNLNWQELVKSMKR